MLTEASGKGGVASTLLMTNSRDKVFVAEAVVSAVAVWAGARNLASAEDLTGRFSLSVTRCCLQKRVEIEWQAHGGRTGTRVREIWGGYPETPGVMFLGTPNPPPRPSPFASQPVPANTPPPNAPPPSQPAAAPTPPGPKFYVCKIHVFWTPSHLPAGAHRVRDQIMHRAIFESANP